MEEVYLIAGKLNNSQMVRYWRVNHDMLLDIARGDFAIVGNVSGFDLVEIIGTMYVERKNVPLISCTKYENMKDVKMVIAREKLKPEQK